MVRELFNALKMFPQPRPLKVHVRAVMLLLGFCTSLLLGWSVLFLLGGKRYAIFILGIFPMWQAAKISGLLLRGAIMCDSQDLTLQPSCRMGRRQAEP
jgi:hypothetical protein